MGHKAEWKSGEIPTMKEITVIKLYTDWDELQAELKKCFRLESVDDIVNNYSLSPNNNNNNNNSFIKQPSLTIDECISESVTPEPMYLNLGSPKVNINALGPGTLKHELSTLSTSISGNLSITNSAELSKEVAIDRLKKRLSEFFHWRGNLLIFINKFSQIIEPTLNDKEFVLYHGV
eukprot:205524_1